MVHHEIIKPLEDYFGQEGYFPGSKGVTIPLDKTRGLIGPEVPAELTAEPVAVTSKFGKRYQVVFLATLFDQSVKGVFYAKAWHFREGYVGKLPLEHPLIPKLAWFDGALILERLLVHEHSYLVFPNDPHL